MIKGVIFDMDGVIIDSEKLYNRFWRQASKDFGYNMTFEHALSIRSLAPEFAIPKLNKVFGEEFPYYEIKKHRIDIMNKYVLEHGIDKKEGVDELLDYLKENNIKTAVATASDMDRTSRYLNMAGVYEKFDEFVCGQDVLHGKPEPDIYLEAVKKLGLEANQCMALEDSKNGIEAAYRAGLKAVMVPDLDEPDEETINKLYAKVKTLKDVISLL